MSQPFCNNSAQIRQLMQESQPLKRALAAAKAADAFRRAHFTDDLSLLSGWGHDFCCPDCAAQLVYEYDRPQAYVCPNCGRRASGLILDEAWAYYTRHKASADLLSSALCWQLDGDSESLDYLIRYVDFYADHYAALPLHGTHAGQGKVMGQSLDEAVWALNVLSALNVCGRKAFGAERLSRWMNDLFRPMADVLAPQAQFVHNIPLWLWCAIGAIGLFFEDDALLEYALENEYGIRRQIREGFTADGLWYEGSLGYHYYSARALTHFLCFYAQKNPQDELFTALRKAYEVPAELSPDGVALPAVNDGWYPLSADKELEGILRAWRILQSPILDSMIGSIYGRHPELFETADALLFLRGLPAVRPLPGRGPAKAFPSMALGALYQPMQVLMKCGVLTLSHMHDDCMAISIPPFSDDLGTPGYGHALTDRYYRRTLAHNTFLMDGQSQPHRPVFGQVAEIDGGVQGHADEIYDGVCCTRTLTGAGNTVLDDMLIQSDEPHLFDWVFRAAGICELPQGAVPAELPYDMLSEVRRYPPLSAFEAVYELNGRKLLLRIDPETLRQAEVYAARIPGNPADQLQTAVLLRIRGASVRFRASYEQR